jgi:hypothetical protein
MDLYHFDEIVATPSQNKQGYGYVCISMNKNKFNYSPGYILFVTKVDISRQILVSRYLYINDK